MGVFCSVIQNEKFSFLLGYGKMHSCACMYMYMYMYMYVYIYPYAHGCLSLM